MSVDKDELHTYLALAGNQRLPHLEEEIFADEESTTIYLHNLCRELMWYTKIPTTDPCNAILASLYSWFNMQGRWAAAECIIASDQAIWRDYAAENGIE